MSEARGRQTILIVEAGEIIQSLTPMRLATLSLIEDDAIETQLEIAEELNCTPSAISQHLTALSNIPIPIVSRDGNATVTTEGNKILGIVSETLKVFGTEFDNIVWRNEDKMAEISSCLDPFHSTRGPLLSLVLYSIGVRSSVGEKIDLLNTQEPIRVSPIVTDVRDRQQERGEGVTRDKVRWRLTKLEEASSITVDSKAVELTDKGHAQARLLERIIQRLEKMYHDESSTEDSKSATSDHITSQQTHVSSPLTDLDEGAVVSFDAASTDPTIMPAYCHGPDSAPVLPLTDTITVGELIEAATRLGQQYDNDKKLELNWTLWTQTEELNVPNYDTA